MDVIRAPVPRERLGIWAALIQRLDDLDAKVRPELAQRCAHTLMNLGYYHSSFGSFLLSTAITEQDIDNLIGAIEQSLHNLDLVG